MYIGSNLPLKWTFELAVIVKIDKAIYHVTDAQETAPGLKGTEEHYSYPCKVNITA